MTFRDGFLLGVSNGGVCLAYCTPVLVPWLLGEGRTLPGSAMSVGGFLGGRFVGYSAFAVLAWLTHITLVERLPHQRAITGAVTVALAVLLIVYGFAGRAESCRAASAGGALKKLGLRNRWLVPVSLGLLTGLSLCPPFLLAIVLTSAATLTPTYCAWLCPFKTVTEYAAVTSATTLIQAVIFVSLFAGLVVVGPVLTKRRTQCGLFCPMGAFQSLTNRLNVFEVRIDPGKCVQCGRCARACPTFSLDRESIARGRTRLTCTRCGRCIDECSKGAASYHIRGTPPGVRPQVARLMFVYPAFLLLGIMGSSMIAGAVKRLLLLATTGSMIK